MTATSDRYSRHVFIEEIGSQGQERIARTRCLVVGAGGIGSPSALALAEAGVAGITIVDSDNVDVSNLPRQILHTPDRVGINKALSAQMTLARINPDVPVTAIDRWADEALLAELMAQVDIVLDCTDNFKTRHAVNRAAQRTRTPLITASAIRWSLQVAMFDFSGSPQPCYQCLFPEDDLQDVRAAQVGVLAPVTSLAGMIAAEETLKWAAGLPSLAGKLLILDTLSWQMQVLGLSAEPQCPVCGTHND